MPNLPKIKVPEAVQQRFDQAAEAAQKARERAAELALQVGEATVAAAQQAGTWAAKEGSGLLHDAAVGLEAKSQEMAEAIPGHLHRAGRHLQQTTPEHWEAVRNGQGHTLSDKERAAVEGTITAVADFTGSVLGVPTLHVLARLADAGAQRLASVGKGPELQQTPQLLPPVDHEN